MTSKNAAETARPAQPPETSLDSKYRAIGISAVAAALRYASEGRNPADAPAVVQDSRHDKWHADLAA
jgi:hypothetical protein